MNASDLLRTIPLGALIAFSDGTPRPPDRFKKKLSAWKNTNGMGILTKKAAATRYASGYEGAASFSLRLAEYGTTTTLVMIVTTSFSETSALDFTVESLAQGDTIRLGMGGELIAPQDLIRRQNRGDSLALQYGETEHPNPYGAGFPSPVLPTDDAVLDLPGVKTFIRHKTLLDTSGASLIAVRDDGYHVTFPGTFCTAIVGALDAMPDDTARSLLLGLMKRREDGESLTQADLTRQPA